MSENVIFFEDTPANATAAYRFGYAAGLRSRGLGPAGGAAPGAATGATDSPPAPQVASGVARPPAPTATLHLALPGGALTASQLHAVAHVARHDGDGTAEATPAGGLVLAGLAPGSLAGAAAGLDAAGLSVSEAAPVGTSVAGVRRGHVGIAAQRSGGLNDVGVSLPVGWMTAHQMDGLALAVALHGSGRVCVTRRQNVVLPDIATPSLGAVARRVRAMGLGLRSNAAAAGLVVRPGKADARAAAEMRAHGRILCRHLDRAVVLDMPVGIALGQAAPAGAADIALAARRGPDGGVTGYDVVLATATGRGQSVLDGWPAADLPGALARLLHAWLQRRAPTEPFAAFARRHDDTTLGAMLVGAV